jgi:hypothetical protein
VTGNQSRKLAAGSATQAPASTNVSQKLNPGDEALPGTPGTGEDICPQCHGEGRIDGVHCPNCGGTGKVVRAIGGA